MNSEQVQLRCDDKREAIVLSVNKYDGQIDDYELSFEDSYIHNKYSGFIGRLKRAWRAFIDKPVYYTSIYTEDKNKIKQFFIDCIELIDKEV